jgi:hypothetical protein
MHQPSSALSGSRNGPVIGLILLQIQSSTTYLVEPAAISAKLRLNGLPFAEDYVAETVLYALW